MTNSFELCLIFSVADALRAVYGGTALYMTVAHDKGKPAARQGRKAVSLHFKAASRSFRVDCLVAEGDLKTSLLLQSKSRTVPPKVFEDFFFKDKAGRYTLFTPLKNL